MQYSVKEQELFRSCSVSLSLSVYIYIYIYIYIYKFSFSKAEEITLTIGQAFDLAYRKFLESSSKDMDMKKQYLLLQKKVELFLNIYLFLELLIT